MSDRIRRSHWYTVSETARILGVSEESIRRAIRAGDLEASFTHHGTGGGFRIKHSTLVAEVRERYPHLKLDLEDDDRDDEDRGN